jgi:hypothetical protein
LDETYAADNDSVDALLLLAAVVASAALAAAIAQTVLACTIYLMRNGLPCTLHWRPVIFAAALFWFWYLAPAIAKAVSPLH